MLNGKTALITGASRGIGAAIAAAMAEAGADVAVVYNSGAEKAEAVCSEITEKYGVKAFSYQCNVADSAQCAELIKKVTADLGGVDILVNNAGITKDNLLVSMSEENFDAVINTNLKGCFNMIKACGRNFIRRKYGKIINISSVSALIGTAGQCNYAASKAGVIALTKAAAREFASKNICCNAIAPGFISTDMTAELEEKYISSIPLKRAGTPKDVAALAVFLADNASDYITGEVIKIDGGLAIGG
ncbi:MAG: 3-oxoacyl-[acyl-carrier-protein] reductase [Ruminococcus sp.]